MKRMWVALALAGLAGPALAQRQNGAAQEAPKAPVKEVWRYVAVKGGAFGWETANIVPDPARGTLAAMRFMYFSTPVTNQAKPFRWILQDAEFNCAAKTLQLLDGQYLDDDGEPVADMQARDKPQPLKPGPDQLLKEVLCDGVTLKDTHETDDLVRAMDGAAKIALP